METQKFKIVSTQKRANTKITEIKGSHAVFISQPEAVAAVIIKASYARALKN